ncbi:MAG: tRNA-specific 2-thiouridylase MnmA [Parcubacteria group bacterium GW2011_GWC1_38_17]|nr:MAG: tRNA-specific 2-thiouridylase MnmA [Parcubacteria group bacterium GW2011_GWC2_36_17]KKQ38860.1 MAG: tRNA-specific 2-thiouridylase MnmA [Candidatus Moranbacteria bacterium GW2011_GWF2_37_7]KKQ43665.1 MAG: tRNA-specific 2-thiouridylase MnmA [Parcubacteria group bacterium GW2011_GWE2_37_8]KKQ58446.1 MAG: tRNA-specific 2-thiouridylase MnmA [Parcubacteria group bacterium GW2011_GWC1_38_17]KKQ59152.1 MAG: tRNA-specific 2-thiouridylase MnmA [Parcubacteria group bacterium GW2011_GWD1_38_16]
MSKIINKNKKVFVAMSGGVDSSVAALLLKKQGYDVVGVFMKYWMDENDIPNGEENRCCSLEARRDAMRVCAQLGMSFLTWDFQKEFKKAVVDNFISGYKMGITPNPCVVCNKEIKLGLFLKRAMKEGADFVATGHYAKISQPRNFSKLKVKSSKLKEKYRLLQARDGKKDQSYFLYNLTQKQLAHILFPLGNLTKDKVREIAQGAGLPVALKRDSQEVCFVKNADLRGFLKTRIHAEKGIIIEAKSKKRIGEHEGAQFFTIGQRAPIGGKGPYYVIGKNIKKNQLIVAQNGDQNLFVREFVVKDVNWIGGKAPKMPFECMVKTRYQQKAQKCIIELRIKNYELCVQKKKSLIHNSCFMIHFLRPQRAVAPGQSAVFLKGKEIIGGGVILQ